MKWCRAAVLIFLAFSSAAVSGVAQDKPAPIRSLLIGPDDTITMEILGCDELNKAWRVSASGDLSLPLVGKVHAEGRTVEELESEIETRLKKFVIDPQVTAYVSETRSQPVVVTGAVQTPGTFQLGGSRTLLDMLVRAGGPRDAGSTLTLRRDTRFGTLDVPGAVRENSGRYSVAELKVEDVLEGRASISDIPIKPYDVISVSAHQLKNVYIIGEVNKPGTVELISSDHIPLSILVAMAGGLTHQASAAKTKIMEDGGVNDKKAITEVNLNRIIAGQSPDCELQAGDIVVVPSSHIRAYMQALSMSMLNSSPILLLGKF
jgi:polysaccharide export outer membrane protein